MFGDKTWEDIRRITCAKLSRTFGGATPHDVDDAAQEALVDLLQYWATLPSSISDDTNKNFAFALRRCWHTSSKYLWDALQQQNQETSAGVPDEGDPTWMQGNYVHQPEPLDPLDELIEDENNDELLEAVSRLPADELRSWVQGLIDGESLRATEVRTGIPMKTVQRRRATTLARMGSHSRKDVAA